MRRWSNLACLCTANSCGSRRMCSTDRMKVKGVAETHTEVPSNVRPLFEMLFLPLRWTSQEKWFLRYAITRAFDEVLVITAPRGYRKTTTTLWIKARYAYFFQGPMGEVLRNRHSVRSMLACGACGVPWRVFSAQVIWKLTSVNRCRTINQLCVDCHRNRRTPMHFTTTESSHFRRRFAFHERQ